MTCHLIGIYLSFFIWKHGFGWECEELPYNTVNHEEFCLKKVCIVDGTATFILKINNLFSKLLFFSHTFSPVFFSTEIQTIYVLHVSSFISHAYKIFLFFLFFLPFFFYISLFFMHNTSPNILLYFIQLFGLYWLIKDFFLQKLMRIINW